MEQAQLPFDVTAGRHLGNPNSQAANLRIHPHKESDREAIRIQIASQGFAGLTINEIKLWNPRKERFKYPNEFSGRLRELVIAGEIFDSQREPRDGCTVYVSRREWVRQ